MKIKVTDLTESIKLQHEFDHVIGALDPNQRKWALHNLDWTNRDMFWFEDDINHTGARIEQIQDIINTVKSKNLMDKNIIVHCAAGIGRSPAIAISLLVMSGLSIEAAITEIANQRPFMWPNMLIIQHFDNLLKLHGELFKSVTDWKSKSIEDDKLNKTIWIKQDDGKWVREKI